MRNSNLMRLLRFVGLAAVALALLSSLVFGFGRGHNPVEAARQAPLVGTQNAESLAADELVPDEFVPGELLVNFQTGTPRALAEDIIAQLGTEVIRNFGDDLQNMLAEAGVEPPEQTQEVQDLLDSFWLRIIDGQSVEDTVAEFLGEATVELAIPNVLAESREHQPTPNDPWFPDQWNLLNAGQIHEASDLWYWQGAYQGGPGIIDADVDAPQGWDLHFANFGTVDCTSVVVGIVDFDGIDRTHPDLAANVLYEVDFGLPPRWDDHATAVAGVVGAVGNNGLGIAGICWKAKLVSLRISSAASTASAVVHAVGQRLIFNTLGFLGMGANFKVLNMSFGLSPHTNIPGVGVVQTEPWLVSSFALANAFDILITAAAANRHWDTDARVFGDPPCTVPTPNVICVTASDDDDSLANEDDVPDAWKEDPFEQPASCADGLDNGVDGLIDGADPDCAAFPFVEDLPWSCSDGIDNGRDGDADGADPDCGPWPAYGATEVDIAAPGDDISTTATRGEDTALQAGSCADGIDNGGDGFTDANEALPPHLNAGCAEDIAELLAVPGPCADGIDNGGDGLIDAADPDCGGPPELRTLQLEDFPWSCADGLDNGGDGAADDPDRGCIEDAPGGKSWSCHDGIDNGGDGPSDGGDADCTTGAPIEAFDGTSFAAPHVAGIAALCWSIPGLAGLSATDMKKMILRFPDRLPGLADAAHPIAPPHDGPATAGARLRWPCSSELGDAPNSYKTVAGDHDHLIGGPGDGPIHWDYGNEWFGPDASTEHNANTPLSLDQDGPANLVDMDVPYDDGGFTYIPPPAQWVAGLLVMVEFKVCSDYLGMPDASGGRYGGAQPNEKVYVNGFFDWNRNGTFDPERLILAPTNVITELQVAAGVGAGTSVPPTNCVDVVRWFIAEGKAPPWLRWRLDYGEDAGSNVPGSFIQDPLTVIHHEKIATFGEVEDYPLLEIDYFCCSVAELTINTPMGSDTVTLTGPTTVEVDLGSVDDTDGDFREQVQTEIVQLELTGTSALLGPVTVRLRDPAEHPFQRSTGEIEEAVDTQAGRLDVPPFDPSAGAADSFFDVYFEIEAPGAPPGLQLLHNGVAKHMETTIDYKPPPPGTTYESPTVIPLLKVDGSESGISIGATFHTPGETGDPSPMEPPKVGGILEFVDVDFNSPTEATDSSRDNALPIAAAAAGAVIVLAAGGGWYARRRWMR